MPRGSCSTRGQYFYSVQYIHSYLRRSPLVNPLSDSLHKSLRTRGSLWLSLSHKFRAIEALCKVCTFPDVSMTFIAANRVIFPARTIAWRAMKHLQGILSYPYFCLRVQKVVEDSAPYGQPVIFILSITLWGGWGSWKYMWWQVASLSLVSFILHFVGQEEPRYYVIISKLIY